MSEIIPAVLVISNVTYGFYKKKPLYKCVTCNDITFYVAYHSKQNHTNFSTNNVNKYVLVQDTGIKQGTYNIAIIQNTIGLVSDPKAISEYNYQCVLYKWPLEIPEILYKQNSWNEDSYGQYNDRIYTVDPKGSLDLDDAFSIHDNVLSIMIANVPVYNGDSLYGNPMYNGIKTVSTIYTPDKLYNMLRDYKKYSLLTDNTYKYVLCLSIDLTTGIHTLDIKKILVYKNLDYDSNDPIIDSLIETVNILNRRPFSKYKVVDTVVDSHKAIEYIMIYFSIYCANYLKERNLPAIYRCLVDNDSELSFLATSEIDYTKSAVYTKEPCVNTQFGTYYVHITSPIRRLVDNINMILVNYCIQNYSIQDNFVQDNFVPILNGQQKAINKMQNQLNLLNMLSKYPDKIYEGLIIESTICNNLNNKYQVLLQNERIIVSLKTTENLNVGDVCSFKLYNFENKNNFKQKIKLQLL